MQQKKWVLLSRNNKTEDVLRLSKEYGIPPVIATILLNRGIENVGEYISSATDLLIDPFLMFDMEKAVSRIIAAIESNEKITVYGDYDVDGITSTAILVKFLKEHKANVNYYIPDRLEEGYGINKPALDLLASQGTSLLITVDCGITAVSEVQYANELGVEVVITDHHECKEQLPEAYCVLNPKQPHCPYPFKRLAGVGVVFKLLQALTLKLKFHMKELIEEYIDIVAIGTVADVMSLVGENRIIVKRGLELLPYTTNKGIKALVEQAEIDGKEMSTGTIGFMIAPRINAAGRMGDPKCAVELLLAKDEMTAKRYAQKLDNENKERQATELRILEDALNIMAYKKEYYDDYVLVLDHEKWHHGIIGIVASKISEKFNKPTILISTEDEFGKGSGRSIKTFNLFKALEACSDQLLKFGGHELAAGLSIMPEQIEEFRQKINRYAKSIMEKEDFIPRINVDVELPIDFINLGTVERLMVLEPYGMGNSNPVFFARNLTVASIRPLSEGKHIKLLLTGNDHYIDAIGFNMGSYLDKINVSDTIDIVFNLDVNVFRGDKQAQVLLKDMRFSNS